jgi:hypothetical protein
MHTNTPTLVRQMPANPPDSPHHSNQDQFVLLCVNRGGRLHHEEIKVPATWKDDQFFDEFRIKYSALRGFWRIRFHPQQFYCCDFSRFVRIDANRLAWENNELPPENNPSYSFVLIPPRTPYRRPLNSDFWLQRYKNRIHTQRTLSIALPKIPKKQGRFQLSTHNDFEDMWGLNVVYYTSGPIVCAWCMLAIVTTFWFIPFWLSEHPGDFSNATVPIMLLLSLMTTFYTILSPTFGTTHF